METIIRTIRRVYGDMGPGEKRIADVILQSPQRLIDNSISDFSAQCGVGNATVVRFARRIGLEGYQALRIGMARELSDRSYVGGEVTKKDGCSDIFGKRIAEIAAALTLTQSVMNERDMDLAAQKLMDAGRIVLFGLGNSAGVAQDAAHKFLRLGCNAQACSDNHMQAIIASHLDGTCVAVGISHSGASRDILDALEIARIHGAFTIAVTNFGNSPITKKAELSLFTKATETDHSIFAMSSRIAQLCIFDAIYTYIVVHSDKAAVQAIYNTEVSLQTKKVL